MRSPIYHKDMRQFFWSHILYPLLWTSSIFIENIDLSFCSFTILANRSLVVLIESSFSVWMKLAVRLLAFPRSLLSTSGNIRCSTSMLGRPVLSTTSLSGATTYG